MSCRRGRGFEGDFGALHLKNWRKLPESAGTFVRFLVRFCSLNIPRVDFFRRPVRCCRFCHHLGDLTDLCVQQTAADFGSSNLPKPWAQQALFSSKIHTICPPRVSYLMILDERNRGTSFCFMELPVLYK